MERHAGRDEFYSAYPELARGWGDLDHTGAPGGWGTAFSGITSEGDDRRATETWAVHVVGPYAEVQQLAPDDPREVEAPVPGVVAATSSGTEEVLVLSGGPDLRPAWAAIRDPETGPRRPRDYTLEEVATAVRRAP